MSLLRPIPGYEGRYSITPYGDVWSHLASKFLKQMYSMGYLNVGICLLGGQQAKIHVHRLVMLAFVGPRPNGLDINHKNRRRDDNRLENLEYVTHAYNIKHGYDGLARKHQEWSCKGSKNGAAKLSECDVLTIRTLHKQGHTRPSLARRYHVSVDMIRRIVLRLNWRHI